MNYRLKSRHGYWDISKLPIGGSFRRAPVEGIVLTDIEIIEYQEGCNRIARDQDGRLIAFHSVNIEKVND